MPKSCRRMRRWTRQELDELWSLVQQGMSIRHIADTLGRTESSVRHRLYQCSWYEPSDHRRWSADEDRVLREYAADGAPLAECAAQLGRTLVAVRQRLRALGVRHAHPGRSRDIDGRARLLTALTQHARAWVRIGELAQRLGQPVGRIYHYLVELRQAGLVQHHRALRCWRYCGESRAASSGKVAVPAEATDSGAASST